MLDTVFCCQRRSYVIVEKGGMEAKEMLMLSGQVLA